MNYFILVDHAPIPVDDVRVWAKMMETDGGKGRIVAQDELPGGVRVSTVFLGLDQRFDGGGLPILFETMVFGGEYDQGQWRYSTWDEAVAGHAEALKLAK
jgi:hypothetical protein